MTDENERTLKMNLDPITNHITNMNMNKNTNINVETLVTVKTNATGMRQ